MNQVIGLFGLLGFCILVMIIANRTSILEENKKTKKLALKQKVEEEQEETKRIKNIQAINAATEAAMQIIRTKAKEIIGNSIKLGGLEIAEQDFPVKMNWQRAKYSCSSGLGNNWRLPTEQELSLMFNNKDTIGGFARGSYWSSTSKMDTMAFGKNFQNGFMHNLDKWQPNYVRAVRNYSPLLNT